MSDNLINEVKEALTQGTTAQAKESKNKLDLMSK